MCFGPHQVSGLRRPPRTRTLEPQPEAGGGDPAHARTRGRPVPAGPPPHHPSVSIQRSLVPKRHYGSALPLLGGVGRLICPCLEGLLKARHRKSCPTQRKEHVSGFGPAFNPSVRYRCETPGTGARSSAYRQFGEHHLLLLLPARGVSTRPSAHS